MPDHRSTPAGSLGPPRFFLRGTKRCIATAIDMIGALARPFLGGQRGNIADTNKIRSILLIRLDHIGDVIMSTALLQSIHACFPEAAIDILAKPLCAPLLEEIPFVRNIIPMGAKWTRRQGEASTPLSADALKEGEYDLAISPRGDLRDNYLAWKSGAPWRVGFAVRGGGFFLTHTAPYDLSLHQTERELSLLHVLGCQTNSGMTPHLWLTEEEQQAGSEAMQSVGVSPDAKPVLIAPFAATPLKAWPIESFLELGRSLHQQETPCAYVVPPDQADAFTATLTPTDPPLLPSLDLRVLAAAYSVARMVVCNDSGPMHLATAVDTPVVAIFGPTCDDITGPPATLGTILTPPADIRPRWYPATPPPPEEKCRRAFEAIPVKTVLDAVMARL